MRLLPLTSDAVLISTALAGIRRAGNFEYPLDRINSTALRWLAHQFLFVGELCLDLAVEVAKHHPKLFHPLAVRHGADSANRARDPAVAEEAELPTRGLGTTTVYTSRSSSEYTEHPDLPHTIAVMKEQRASPMLHRQLPYQHFNPHTSRQESIQYDGLITHNNALIPHALQMADAYYEPKIIMMPAKMSGGHHQRNLTSDGVLDANHRAMREVASSTVGDVSRGRQAWIDEGVYRTEHEKYTKENLGSRDPDGSYRGKSRRTTEDDDWDYRYRGMRGVAEPHSRNASRCRSECQHEPSYKSDLQPHPRSRSRSRSRKQYTRPNHDADDD
ncbi:hypothetical protein BASA50_010141 [Batrachochytrium salamandrivorans]|uniref:Uncharacterized protein n=1 Tax=Batrachochytrium salamandrivorans TaxID=1357716 RepID=A0ABQ8F224_9FUNG|nr:hypothetical protein BASA62_000577 [Batrachochytrium salamandrivorans]KAH6583710.1 hypothetical protein BASA60_001308 [Batrachochytrium salamandrivorans]KAH6589266.1 hypothetical protein BASA50_010141 [Batrachochytrium salamandrivorans]KAH6590800.1 hypothetical protein BASA61_005137 [Batrachochytrium salamandrivorans]KAH9258787.1 hypothetical protein BASA81_002851 [Batrachochytrium salamandrivorans]